MQLIIIIIIIITLVYCIFLPIVYMGLYYFIRTTAAGIHLVAARIGAIIGTNIFGAFVHVNPNIPIFMVVAMLIVGALAALPLPKTTRKTLLK